jgi:hypothetical protein
MYPRITTLHYAEVQFYLRFIAFQLVSSLFHHVQTNLADIIIIWGQLLMFPHCLDTMLHSPACFGISKQSKLSLNTDQIIPV